VANGDNRAITKEVSHGRHVVSHHSGKTVKIVFGFLKWGNPRMNRSVLAVSMSSQIERIDIVSQGLQSWSEVRKNKPSFGKAVNQKDLYSPGI
jgi:hypothetical protein